jgi:hypothetical protein
LASLSWSYRKSIKSNAYCPPLKIIHPRPLLFVYNQYLPFIKTIQLPDYPIKNYLCSNNVYTGYSKGFPLGFVAINTKDYCTNITEFRMKYLPNIPKAFRYRFSSYNISFSNYITICFPLKFWIGNLYILEKEIWFYCMYDARRKKFDHEKILRTFCMIIYNNRCLCYGGSSDYAHFEWPLLKTIFDLLFLNIINRINERASRDLPFWFNYYFEMAGETFKQVVKWFLNDYTIHITLFPKTPLKPILTFNSWSQDVFSSPSLLDNEFSFFSSPLYDMNFITMPPVNALNPLIFDFEYDARIPEPPLFLHVKYLNVQNPTLLILVSFMEEFGIFPFSPKIRKS